MDVKRSQRAPFTFFGSVTLFKNLILKFLEIFQNLPCQPQTLPVDEIVSQMKKDKIS